MKLQNVAMLALLCASFIAMEATAASPHQGAVLFCPSGTWVAHRVDKWRKTKQFPFGQIVKSRWKQTCLTAR